MSVDVLVCDTCHVKNDPRSTGGQVARDGFHISARVLIPCAGNKSGKISNTWNFLAFAGTPPSDFTALGNAIQAVYNTGAAGVRFSWFLGPQCLRTTNATVTEFYSVDPGDPHHYLGSPVQVQPWTLGAAADTTPLPNDVAIAVSYRAAYGSDPEHAGTSRPRASDRGRIYLGPLCQSATTVVTPPTGGTYAIAANNIVTAVPTQLHALSLAATAASFYWCVWSRKEQAFKPATQYAINNDLDSQRRRGLEFPLQTWVLI